MPNWCECDLEINGKKEEVEKFMEEAKTENSILDGDVAIPYPWEYRLLDKYTHKDMSEMPEEIKKELTEKGYSLDKDGFNQGGYEWCIENWGTKWGIVDPSIVEEKEVYDEYVVTYTFRCAWSPPTPVIVKFGEMYPSLNFKMNYYEMGMQFQGVLAIENGEVIEDKAWEYDGERGG